MKMHVGGRVYFVRKPGTCTLFCRTLGFFLFSVSPPSLVMEAVRSYSTTLETLLYFKKRAHFLVCRQHVNQLSLFRTCLRQSLLLPSGQAKGRPWRTLLSALLTSLGHSMWRAGVHLPWMRPQEICTFIKVVLGKPGAPLHPH